MIDENKPAMNTSSPPSAHAVLILPPASVEPSRVREPSDARDKRVDVVGSNERDVELSNKSSPANVPARPTWPIRLKSILGSEASARLEDCARKKNVARADALRGHLDDLFMAPRALRHAR